MKTETAVPLLDLNAQFSQIRQEVTSAIAGILESQHFIMGPEVKAFEQQAAEYCGAGHAIGCASGSDALLLSLMALDIGPGDAVITSPYTFFATGWAIARLGATPVFLDIDELDFNLDPDATELFLEGRHPLNSKLGIGPGQVKALIPVHLYGQMADMGRFVEMGRKYDVAIIEDAAQAMGSEYKGRRAGSMGDFGCFSFFPSKNLGGYGDGGMVTTQNDELAEKLAVLRLHGASPKYHHSIIGINSRLDALQAAVLRVKLNYLDAWSEARRARALAYGNLFREAGLAGRLSLPLEVHGRPEQGGRHIYHQYVIRTEARDKLIQAFQEKNIGHAIYYPIPLHEQECFRYLGYEPGDCPVSSRCSTTSLALPIYPELTRQQQEYVVEAIKGVFGS